MKHVKQTAAGRAALLRYAGAAVLGVAVSGLAAASASADSLVVNTSPGTPNNTNGISTNPTTGANMTGMVVTAFFNNGTSQSATWSPADTGSGGANGTGWSVFEPGDTSVGDWSLTNTSALPISRVVFDGGPGRTVFDINPDTTGTPNSGLGKPFTIVSGGANRDIVVTYRDVVSVGAPAVVFNDLYRTMDVVFNAPGGAITAGSAALVFETETDTTTSDIVPEPSGVLLLAAALGASALRRRRGRPA